MARKLLKVNAQSQNEYRTYFSYRVYENGDIYSMKGKRIKKTSLTYKNSHCILNIDGKYRRKNVAKLMFEVFFPQEYDAKKIVWFKDGDCTNVFMSNLIQMTRIDYMKMIDMRAKMKKFTREEAEKIREEYFSSKEESVAKEMQLSIEKLAKKYKCSLTVIQKILKGTYY